LTAVRKSLTVDALKSEEMCFNSRSDNLPPIYHDGTQLFYTDTFKYLVMVCDKAFNLNVAADAALRPFTAGTTSITFRVNKCVQEVPKDCMPRFGSSKRTQFQLACMQVRSGLPPTYNKAKRWTI